MAGQQVSFSPKVNHQLSMYALAVGAAGVSLLALAKLDHATWRAK